MQQEVIKKKHEIIHFFLKNNILISPELLKELNNDEQISRIFNFLKSNQTDSLAIIDLNLKQLIDETKIQTNVDESKKTFKENQVKIIYSYKEEPKKRGISSLSIS